jgi:glutaminyl-peptide cyclotransferase
VHQRPRLTALAIAFTTSACSAAGSGALSLRVEVVRTYPHDPTAFTQGLLVDDKGRLLESTGRYNSSDVRVVDVATGAVLDRTSIPGNLFGEGLAQVGNRLVQLTWQERRALVFDAATLDLLSVTFDYDSEGWGLCHDGARLVMSDGSSTLTFRVPDTFERAGAVGVTLGGAALDQLNELECAEGKVYANVWQTDTIVEIDPEDGRVTAQIDASGLLSSEERAETDVLNGIAKVPGKDTFYITGKLWPKLFEVRFVRR